MALLAAPAFAAEPITNSLGMKLMPIPAGSFTMGQDGPVADYKMMAHPTKDDDADVDEKPTHRVSIGTPFQTASTGVNLEQYRHFKPEFRRDNGKGDEAVSGVSWDDAMAFETGRQKLSPANGSRVGIRLPCGHCDDLQYRRSLARGLSKMALQRWPH